MAKKTEPAVESVHIVNSASERMAVLLKELVQGEGFLPSPLAGVTFMRSTIHVPRSPVTYAPGIVFIAQGRKVGHLGSQAFVYDASNYLALTVPLPFECETIGTPEKPVLGVFVSLAPALIAELLMQMNQPQSSSNRKVRAIDSAVLDEDLGNTVVRLLESLRSTDDTRILGPQIIREITYRVLRGKLGSNLRALAAPQSHFGQISRVLNRIHADYARPCDLDSLARDAGMSVSTFHAHFKSVTTSSPLQYVKAIRLHKARLLMVNDGANAAQAAGAVGYESASQFSREFKRHFGEAPATNAIRMRASLVNLV